jgi:hypothetical protein
MPTTVRSPDSPCDDPYADDEDCDSDLPDATGSGGAEAEDGRHSEQQQKEEDENKSDVSVLLSSTSSSPVSDVIISVSPTSASTSTPPRAFPIVLPIPTVSRPPALAPPVMPTRREEGRHPPSVDDSGRLGGGRIGVVFPPAAENGEQEEVDRRTEVLTGSSVSVRHSSGVFSSSLGMNIGLIAGIAAGIVILLLVLAYAVCKYRGGTGQGRGGGSRRPPRPGAKQLDTARKDPGVGSRPPLPTGLGDVGGGGGLLVGYDGRQTSTTTPLLPSYRDQSTANGNTSASPPPGAGGPVFGSGGRRKKKDVKEWYV